jgi:hypothetical protein
MLALGNIEMEKSADVFLRAVFEKVFIFRMYNTERDGRN